MPATLILPSRFNGPDDSGNGGYTAGRIAQALGGSDVEVRLLKPPPLQRQLQLNRQDDGMVSVKDGNTLIASGKTRRVKMKPQDPVSFKQAEAAAKKYPGLKEHVFPRCFVCGTERSDGLGLHPGPVEGRPGVYACPWVPTEDLAGPGGELRREFVWAALDCPAGWSTGIREGNVAMLGTIAVRLLGAIRAGDEHVVMGWHRSTTDRKHQAASAIYGPDGDALAVSQSVWITVSPK